MISDLISASVGLLYIIPLILYIFTKNYIHIKAFIGVGATTIISETLKRSIIKTTSRRPKGANNCNLMCNDGNQSGQPGMPSSHSANVAFILGFYFQQTNNILVLLILIIYAMAVMASRYLKRCHTINQIVAGAGLGLSLSWIVVRHL
jgi:membrane-associated phospholipid phosphatase